MHYRGAIVANKEVVAKIKVTALRYGRRKLIVCFYSEQMSSLQGYAYINVKKYPPKDKEEENGEQEEKDEDEKVDKRDEAGASSSLVDEEEMGGDVTDEGAAAPSVESEKPKPDVEVKPEEETAEAMDTEEAI